MDTILATLKKTCEGKVKAIKSKKFCKDEKRFGLLDSGATNNVRDVKKKENYKDLFQLKSKLPSTQKSKQNFS